MNHSLNFYKNSTRIKLLLALKVVDSLILNPYSEMNILSGLSKSMLTSG